jgi:UDP-N-acetylglucosamine 4-epimerase
VFNIAVGDRTTLNRLFSLLRDCLKEQGVPADLRPVHREFRVGDVRHSQADVSKASRLMGYAPSHALADGLREALPWYVRNTPHPAP